MDDKAVLELMKQSADQSKSGKEIMDLRAKVAAELTQRAKNPEEASSAIRRYKKLLEDARKRAGGVIPSSFGKDLAASGAKFTKQAARGVRMMGPIVGPLAGLYTAFATGDASAAIPVFGDIGKAGEGSDQVGYTEEQLKQFRRRKPSN